MRLVLIVLVWMTLLGGCTQLPVDGPNHHLIDRDASEAIVQDNRAVAVDYVLLDISGPVLASLVDFRPDSLFKTFGTGQGTAPELRLGIGDVVVVTIFESSNKGLFGASDTSNRPGNYVTLPPQAVDYAGNIAIPFAGPVRAAGRSITQVQKDIEQRLAKRAIEPQVVISLQEQNATDVAVFGDAANGSFKQRITPGGERILDIIAKAGVKEAAYEIYVTLKRGNTRATVYLPNLMARPEENIFVRPGDIVYLYRDPKTFIALGAVGNTNQTIVQELTGQFKFGGEHLSLAEGVAKAGGLLDVRANAGQVFLYRPEYREVLERLGLNLTLFPPEQKLIPTVYRANYRDPSMFFAASQFQMRNKDIIYVANADSIEVDKFLSYVRLWTGTVAGVASDVLVTQSAVRGGIPPYCPVKQP